MIIKLEYRMDLARLDIEDAVYGDCILELTHHEGLSEREYADIVQFIGDSRDVARNGKISGCFPDNVAMFPNFITLHYTPFEEDDDCVIEDTIIQARKGLCLAFTVRRSGDEEDKEPELFTIKACEDDNNKGVYYCMLYILNRQKGIESVIFESETTAVITEYRRNDS
ncbi:MAG: hypothetical protein LBQ02_04530 [Candidatus Nomurabacteria bacterium]|jgi:hypothetical protein|nr:hypothetical protein [Candidatus Nomurabacteria bacterium]